MTSSDFIPSQLSGRNRRLWHEWRKLEERLDGRSDIVCRVTAANAQQLPVGYCVEYRLRSICGVEHADSLDEPAVGHAPLFADRFLMQIDIPDQYPCVDAPPVFHFLTTDEEGRAIPHPWHPNIRYFGDMAGRVCINMVDTYTDLVWGVERVGHYLRYDCYHAKSEPPYPEDLKVAAWVVTEGEPQGWVYFNQQENISPTAESI
ncbi:MAG: hypothetical protein J6M23_09570 [Bacteroidales bacterium]|nr:hypothetical protein [Bacteroidales bacterium]